MSCSSYLSLVLPRSVLACQLNYLPHVCQLLFLSSRLVSSTLHPYHPPFLLVLCPLPLLHLGLVLLFCLLTCRLHHLPLNFHILFPFLSRFIGFAFPSYTPRDPGSLPEREWSFPFPESFNQLIKYSCASCFSFSCFPLTLFRHYYLLN